ncbi:MAG: heme utilization protein HuvX [Tardiphaga sp.]|nr:heme utilization protein HuvX [Tardiphaga sp.]
MLNTDMSDLKTFLAENPGAVVEDVARDHGVTPRAVLEAMPAGLVRIGGGEHFVMAMQDIAEWGELTLIVHTADGIFETTARVSPGAIGHGYYNLTQPKGLHGHLRHTRCGGVAFVQRAFRGNASAFVAFLNTDGGIMFKVFVGRDDSRALKSDQMARFEALAGFCGAA